MTRCLLERVRGGALAALLGLVAGYATAAVTVTDDRGVSVTLPAPAARIVALSPHLTELVYAAGAGNRLVAVARYSDYPEAARALPLIGDAARVDVERILGLRADLILAWKSGNAPADLANLERLGLRVHASEPVHLADITRMLRVIGSLAGTESVAETAAAAFERDIARLRATYGARAPVRVFYEIWDRPLMTVNGAHIISDLLAVCGGTNVFAHLPLLTPSVTREAVIAAQPQAVVGGSSASGADAYAAEWRAVREGGLDRLPAVYVPPDLIQRATPRIAKGAAVICKALNERRTAAAR